MAFDNLKCPQFFDFTNEVAFSIDVDIYFEKGPVDELDLGFNDQNTDNHRIDHFTSALNDAIHKAQNLHDYKESENVKEMLQETQALIEPPAVPQHSPISSPFIKSQFQISECKNQ